MRWNHLPAGDYSLTAVTTDLHLPRRPKDHRRLERRGEPDCGNVTITNESYNATVAAGGAVGHREPGSPIRQHQGEGGGREPRSAARSGAAQMKITPRFTVGDETYT